MPFDAHISLLINEQLVGEWGQARLGGTSWFVHYQAGFDSGDRPQAILSCVVADNEDHGKPNLVPGSREFVVRLSLPYNPFRFRVCPPGTRESFVCLVTFESMNDNPPRIDIRQLDNVPFAETEERDPSWQWDWRSLPF